MGMQVILDSPFARLGSAPIWGGKKGEFRDWTNPTRAHGIIVILHFLQRGRGKGKTAK